MKRVIPSIIILVLCFFPFGGNAYNSNICKNSTCTQAEVGPFMMGITQSCANLGDCTLNDILTVVVNIGNYVVGIIGAVVLLMYVVGGFFWLISAGNKEMVTKGKNFMKMSSIGLLVVMFSYLGIYAIRGVLQYGSVALTDAENEYVACSGPVTEGKPCDLNSTCTQGGYVCESLCRQNNPGTTESQRGDQAVVRYYDCVDTASYPANSSEGNPYIYAQPCISNACPGAATVQCCQLERDL